jgi:serine/threonine-protein kinase HipA
VNRGTASGAARPDRLHVFHGDTRVGDVFDTTPLAFEYADGWLADPAAFALAAVPLQPGRQDGPAVPAFFENLLPEGELRLYLAQQKQASTLFSLLLEVAGDTAGAFVLLPAGAHPEPPRYEATSWPTLAAALGKRSAAAIDLGGDARISLAGAQDKASLAIFDDGVPRLPRGTAPSTHILKPDIRRLAKVWHSAANEALVMRTAALCGLPTAEVFYEPHTRACVVRRFDRLQRPDGTLARLVQYDLCQLAGTLSERKYEKEGGPDLVACAALIRRYSSRPALDLRQFVQWLFFNLFTGNNDSHAKNLSIQQHADGHIGLTPCYDLMCTRLYPGLSPHFAFAIGGETRPGAVGREQVAALAGALRMQPRFLLQQAADLAARLPRAVDGAVAQIGPGLPPAAQDLAARLRQFIVSTTEKTAARLQA